jgi:hypothetical protein
MIVRGDRDACSVIGKHHAELSVDPVHPPGSVAATQPHMPTVGGILWMGVGPFVAACPSVLIVSVVSVATYAAEMS